RNVADWCCGNAIARCRIRGMSSSSVPFPWACSVRQVAEGGGVRPEDARHPPDAVGLAGRQQERLAARVAALAQESRMSMEIVIQTVGHDLWLRQQPCEGREIPAEQWFHQRIVSAAENGAMRGCAAGLRQQGGDGLRYQCFQLILRG